MFTHLKVVFQTPEAVLVGRRDFFRRRSDSRRKPTLTPPSMTTPEIRALVTGFNVWSPDAGGGAEKSRNIKQDMCFDEGFT